MTARPYYPLPEWNEERDAARRRPSTARFTYPYLLPVLDRGALLPLDGAVVAGHSTGSGLLVCVTCALGDRLMEHPSWRVLAPKGGFDYRVARNGWLQVERCMCCEQAVRPLP